MGSKEFKSNILSFIRNIGVIIVGSIVGFIVVYAAGCYLHTEEVKGVNVSEYNTTEAVEPGVTRYRVRTFSTYSYGYEDKYINVTRVEKRSPGFIKYYLTDGTELNVCNGILVDDKGEGVVELRAICAIVRDEY